MKPQPLSKEQECKGEIDYYCGEPLFKKSSVASAVAWLKEKMCDRNLYSLRLSKRCDCIKCKMIYEAFAGVIEASEVEK